LESDEIAPFLQKYGLNWDKN